MATVVDKISGIMRFPIKSLLGETLVECNVSESGLEGDRALALVDTATGKIASAKQPNLWRDMLKLVARTDTASSHSRIIVSDAQGGQRDHLALDFDVWVSGVPRAQRETNRDQTNWDRIKPRSTRRSFGPRHARGRDAGCTRDRRSGAGRRLLRLCAGSSRHDRVACCPI